MASAQQRANEIQKVLHEAKAANRTVLLEKIQKDYLEAASATEQATWTKLKEVGEDPQLPAAVHFSVANLATNNGTSTTSTQPQQQRQERYEELTCGSANAVDSAHTIYPKREQYKPDTCSSQPPDDFATGSCDSHHLTTPFHGPSSREDIGEESAAASSICAQDDDNAGCVHFENGNSPAAEAG